MGIYNIIFFIRDDNYFKGFTFLINIYLGFVVYIVLYVGIEYNFIMMFFYEDKL